MFAKLTAARSIIGLHHASITGYDIVILASAELASSNWLIGTINASVQWMGLS
jgi:hypothetical protein